MPVYYALLRGDGAGCDHTIGCNMRWERLKATTLDAAKEEALYPSGTHYASCAVDSDKRIDSITIIEVTNEFDLAREIDAIRDNYRIAKEQAKIAEKRREFERLRKELGV